MGWHPEDYIAADVLKELRRASGVKQSEIGRRLGGNQTTFSKMERGAQHVTVGELVLILEMLDKTLADFEHAFVPKWIVERRRNAAEPPGPYTTRPEKPKKKPTKKSKRSDDGEETGGG